MFIPVSVKVIIVKSDHLVLLDSIINADEIVIIQQAQGHEIIRGHTHEVTLEERCFSIQFKNKSELPCLGRIEDFVGQIEYEMRHIERSLDNGSR